MDDSQSSDLFSQSITNMEDYSKYETETYELLIKKIKFSACESINGIDGKLQDYFTNLINDCGSCVHQALEIITTLTQDVNIEIDKLCVYLEDVVCILQILSHFVKSIVESFVFTCHTVKRFSTCTGNIILSVFSHCKNSECIYGNSLCMVEKQLKDLFRNCHELQLTYLMTLEKHLKFNLTAKEDQDVLLQTLDINLKIGDVVQTLDVKTMAAQWKAYSMICEKYSNFLLMKNVFNRSSKLLVSTIESNIKTAFEANGEDKMVQRSLKVANFSLKILLRLCDTFKHSENNNYKHIFRLLIHICLCNSSYYETRENVSPEFSLLMNTHLLRSSEIIIDLLVCEEKFLNTVFTTERIELEDSQLLGYILFITSIMKSIAGKKDVPSDNKDRVISCVFSFLPHCHKWFNIGLKFKYISTEGEIQYYGLYEHLLIHSVSLASTMHLEEYCSLENHLYEALLGTEYYNAFFASNLWIFLCRLSNNQLRLDVLEGLLNVYQKLETHSSFAASPQRVHLSYTIEKLFETLEDSKLQICRRFNIKDFKNIEVWSALKIRNLGDDVTKPINRIITDNLLVCFDKGLNDAEDTLENLIKCLKLASTCSFAERDPRIEDMLLGAWRKACPVCNDVSRIYLNTQPVWMFRFLQGLASLTACYTRQFEQRASSVKILHIISNILFVGNNEIVHLLFKFFCKLSNSLLENQYDVRVFNILTNTVRNLLEESDDIQQHVFSVIISNEDISKLIMPVLQESHPKRVWNNFIDFRNKFGNIEELQKQLDAASEFKYKHKCMEIKINVHETDKIENNFDLGDVYSMFEESDGEEPANKKVKFDVNVENVLVKLETDVELLSHVEENILSDEHKGRIKSLCDKLNNIIY